MAVGCRKWKTPLMMSEILIDNKENNSHFVTY